MYCIMRTEKRKRTDIHGIEKENTRTANNYNNNVMIGMDMFNITLIDSNDWLQAIDKTLQRAGAKVRSNSVVALDTVYTASKDFFTAESDRQDYFRDCLKFHEQRYGHVISAIIHYDETTPHMHVISVPLTKDNRLSARDIIGNKAKMSHVQDLFYEQVGKAYGLDRGIRNDGLEKREHISAQEYEFKKTESELNKVQSELDKAISDLDNAKDINGRIRKRIQERQKELKGINNTLDAKKAEYGAINSDIRQITKDLNVLSEYLTQAEREQIRDINDRYNDER